MKMTSMATFRRDQSGVIFLGLVMAMVIFAAIGAALISTSITSTFNQVWTGLASRAYYLAESGQRYLRSEYENQADDVAKNTLLDELNGKTFSFSPDGSGQFELDMTSYFYRVRTDPNGTSSLALKFIGTEGFDVPNDGFLKVGEDKTFYEYIAPPATALDTDGTTNIYTFTVSPNVPSTTVYTSVRPVIQTTVSSAVNENGTLTLSSGQGILFPPENGMFLIEKQKIKAALPVKTMVPYSYEYRSGDQLFNVQKGPHQKWFSTIDIGSTMIEVAKLLSVDSIGYSPDKTSALAQKSNKYQLSLDISASSPGLKSYWSFDESSAPAADDYGTRDGSLEGGAAYTADGKVEGALSFDGSGYVATTFNPGAEIGSQQSFTVVFWAKPNTVSGFQVVVGSGDWSLPSIERFYIGLYDNEWLWGYGDLHGDYSSGTLPDATVNQWQHIGYVYDKDLGHIIIYVNGIEKYRFAYTLNGGSGFISNINIDIGGIHRQGDLHDTNFDGIIDELAIFNTALDVCEIREIYNVPCNVGCGVFNTAHDPVDHPVLYYPFNCDENDDNQSSCSAKTAVDESGTDKDGNPPDDNDGTVTDAVLAADRFGCEDKAYSFNGSSANIQVQDSDSLEMSDVDKVTVAAWVKKEAAHTGPIWIAILQKSDNSYNLHLYDGKPVFTIHDESGNRSAYSTADDMNVGTWYHLVGTFDGSNVKIYVDGQLKNTTSATNNAIKDTGGQDVGIGYNIEKSGRNFQGQIDDISIWERDLNLSEIQDYYNLTSHK